MILDMPLPSSSMVAQTFAQKFEDDVHLWMILLNIFWIFLAIACRREHFFDYPHKQKPCSCVHKLGWLLILLRLLCIPCGDKLSADHKRGMFGIKGFCPQFKKNIHVCTMRTTQKSTSASAETCDCFVLSIRHFCLIQDHVQSAHIHTHSKSIERLWFRTCSKRFSYWFFSSETSSILY